MASFIAGTSVEPLEFDFSAFDGAKGTIPEPSTEQISSYWANYIGAIQISRLQTRAEAELTAKIPDEETEKLLERIKEVEAASAQRSAETIQSRRKVLADLCSQFPTLEDIQKLPHRVFDAFETYVQKGISPEASSTATTS